ncbi:hypothetical protein ACHAQH_001788 [Verticillium albo-atrum]
MPVELVIGVIGLAIQVIDTAKKVKGVIGSYHSAPREIKRLATKLECAESLCNHIESIFKEKSLGPRRAVISQAMCNSLLQNMDLTMKDLGIILAGLQARANKKGVVEGPGRLFVKQKDSIQKLVAELDSDLTMLSHVMAQDVS